KRLYLVGYGHSWRKSIEGVDQRRPRPQRGGARAWAQLRALSRSRTRLRQQPNPAAVHLDRLWRLVGPHGEHRRPLWRLHERAAGVAELRELTADRYGANGRHLPA